MKKYKLKKKRLIMFLKANKYNGGFFIKEIAKFVKCSEEECVNIIMNIERIKWDSDNDYIGYRYTKANGSFYKGKIIYGIID